MPSSIAIPRAFPVFMGALIIAMSMALLTAFPVAADTTFTIDTSGAEEVCEPADPATCGGDGTGTAVIDVVTETDEICFDLTGEGVTLPITAGHIHEAAAGVAGPVVVPLFTEPEAEFPISGCVTAEAGLVAEIEADPANYYVNLHNEEFPDGALRGQLEVAGGGEEPTGMVMVMKHLCDPSVQSEADFVAVEERAATNPTTPMGVPTLGSTAETVLACPVIVQPGDSQTPGAIGSGSAAFDFTTTDSATTTQTLTTDTTFSGDNGFDTPVEDFACESDIGYDADRDGAIEDDVCLDFSSYAFADVVEGEVTVAETVAPPGARFGTVRLSPPEISDDAAIGLSFTSDGVMTFDSSLDEDDMVTLHVYNFQAAVAATASPTAAASELPDAAVDAPAAGDSMPLLVVLTALGFAISAAVVLRQRAGRIG